MVKKSTINDYIRTNGCYDDYNNNKYANDFLSGLNVNIDNGSAFNLSDYAMIRNGTYGKLMKAYYAQDKEGKTSSTGDDKPKFTLMAGNAGAMAKSAQALMQDSIWEKKTITEKDEKTGDMTRKQ